MEGREGGGGVEGGREGNIGRGDKVEEEIK